MRQRHQIATVLSLVIQWVLAVQPITARAQRPTGSGMAARMRQTMWDVANSAGFIPPDGKPKSFIQIVGIYFQGILGILGVVFLMLIIWDGIKWMRAGSNEETITKAKTGLRNRAIGLAIILLARMITFFFLEFVKPVV